jgi:hypothetical protein
MIIRRSTQRDTTLTPTLLIAASILLLIALILLLSSAPSAHAAENTASPAHVTGGIGTDEMQRLKAQEKDFNLKLVFTLVEGNYLSDVAVTIKDINGKPLLNLNAQGPLVLAKLPRGAYVVHATYEGKEQIRKVSVAERLRTEYFRWSGNPETDFPGPKQHEKQAALTAHRA